MTLALFFLSLICVVLCGESFKLGKGDFVSRRYPRQLGSSRSKDRRSPFSSHSRLVIGAKFNWTEYVIDDYTSLEAISFLEDGNTGVIAAEMGKVYLTKNGGKLWQKVLDLGSESFYWYSITVVNSSYIVASGFNNKVGKNGGYVIRSGDGGKTWTTPTKLLTNWLMFAQRFVGCHGIILQDGGTLITDDCGVTWRDVPINGTAWWGDGFSYWTSGHAIITGLDHLCSTKSFGDSWSCVSPISDVDAGNFFFDLQTGVVGAGWIEPKVVGWVRKTLDGGKTWSKHLLDSPYPIRNVEFVDSANGFAVGGNFFTSVGGVYYSSDSGESWSLELDTGCEMKGIAIAPEKNGKSKVWIVGSNSHKNVVYSSEISLDS